MPKNLRETRIQKEYSQPAKQISGIMVPEAGNLPVWQKRAAENSLHPKPQAPRKMAPLPKFIDSVKWR
jgi:hypothetical protein